MKIELQIGGRTLGVAFEVERDEPVALVVDGRDVLGIIDTHDGVLFGHWPDGEQWEALRLSTCTCAVDEDACPLHNDHPCTVCGRGSGHDDDCTAGRETLESCVCGECFDCPDGWHTDDEMPCSCTADCALADEHDAGAPHAGCFCHSCEGVEVTP